MKPKVFTRKDDLRKELEGIEKKEHAAMVAQSLPILKKKHEGKYYKVANSFGGNKKWWKYIHVQSIEAKDVYTIGIDNDTPTARYNGMSFETDAHGTFHFNKKENGYLHFLPKKSITKQEFNSYLSLVAFFLTKTSK